MIRHEADLVVLGAGFAGCLTACIAARQGLRAVLVDRARHPRFAIGESSTPVADVVLRDLCDRYDLPGLRPLAAWGTWQQAYPHVTGGVKRGFSYFRHAPGTPFRPDPGHADALLVAASADDAHADTHWLRADVDALFASEAQRAGVPLLEDTHLDRIARRPGGPGDGWHLAGRQADAPVEIDAAFVVDATGPAAVLPRTLGVPDLGAACRTSSRALYSHFTGVPRWHDYVAARGARTGDYPFPADAAALHHVLDGGWMWMLRFANDVVSAGFAVDAVRFPLDATVAPEAEWTAWLERYPSLADLFGGAHVVDPPARLVRTGRLQRRYARAAGDGWALLPHTAGFVDPLHSSGIAHTLCGVERLANVLERHWGRPGMAEALDGYSRAVSTEQDFVDRLVAACYHTCNRGPGAFPLWVAASLHYFAAATGYEHARARHRAAHGPAGFDRLFLLADDAGRFDAAAAAEARLAALPASPAPNDVAAFERFTHDALAPYDEVGLLRPAVPHLYPFTVAPK